MPKFHTKSFRPGRISSTPQIRVMLLWLGRYGTKDFISVLIGTFMIYDKRKEEVWIVDVGVLFPWFSSRSRRHHG